MIELHGVTKIYGRGAARRIVCEDLSAIFDGSADVGILGAHGSGKSTLMRMLAGMEMPDRGRIIRRVRVAYPLGFSGAFHPNLSGRDNVRFVARLQGADVDAVIRFVRDFAEVGQQFEEPLYKLSNTMRARLTYATSIAFEADLYLLDEVSSVGDITFKRKCMAALAERRRHARIIMASQNTTVIGRLCKAGAILDGGRLYAFPTMAEAIRVYHSSVVVTDA